MTSKVRISDEVPEEFARMCLTPHPLIPGVVCWKDRGHKKNHYFAASWGNDVAIEHDAKASS